MVFWESQQWGRHISSVLRSSDYKSCVPGYRQNKQHVMEFWWEMTETYLLEYNKVKYVCSASVITVLSSSVYLLYLLGPDTSNNLASEV